MPPRAPRLEDGYTRIANAILDALCLVNLSAYEGRILWHVFRITYGWKGSKEIETSVHQISRVTGLDRRDVQRTLKSLAKKNLVNIKHTPRGNQPGKGIVIGFQKYAARWAVNNRVENLNLPAAKQPLLPAAKQPLLPAAKQPPAMFSKPRF